MRERWSARAGPGRDQILAAINAVHTSARDVRDTDWSQVVALTTSSSTSTPHLSSPWNRAIAVAELYGPEVALTAVDRLEDKLAGYHAYHATRAPTCCAGWAAARSRARRTTRPSNWRATPPQTANLTRRRDQLG